MQVETFQIKDWDDAEMGLVVIENDEWVLVEHIPVDHVRDGFRLYRKKYITARRSGEAEKKVAYVLQLRKISARPPDGFEFKDTLGLLNWVQEKYGLFEFQDMEGSDVNYGRINKVVDGLLVLDSVDADGSMETEHDHDYILDQIRAISFGSDYHDAVCLLWKDALSRDR